jgi:hypothetical protein
MFAFETRLSSTPVTMSDTSVEDSTTPLPAAGRHGCLTTYLIFVIIVNALMAVVYLFGAEAIRRTGANIPDWAFWGLAACGLVNVVSAFALLRLRRWGFWAFVATAVATVAINSSIGLAMQGAIAALLGIAILFGVLHIGKENKAWPRLR